MKLIGKITSVCLMAFISMNAYSQTSFKMGKKDGHYYLTANVNDMGDAQLLAVTNMQAILIGEDNFNRYFKKSDYNEVDKDSATFKSDEFRYKTQQVLNGKVKIGNLAFDGDIYVLENFDNICVPIHALINEADTSANLIRLNFKKKTLDFVGKDAVDINKMHTYRIVEYMPWPVFEASLDIADAYGHNGQTDGKFIFDMSNGTALYLFLDNVAPFIKSNRLKVSPAQDKSFNAKGYGIYADYLKLGDKSNQGISIGILKNMSDAGGVSGSVGPSMFGNGTVILSPAESIIYYD